MFALRIAIAFTWHPIIFDLSLNLKKLATNIYGFTKISVLTVLTSLMISIIGLIVIFLVSLGLKKGGHF